jgi:hypothetical protein
MDMGSNQPLKQMSTRNIYWGTVRRADNMTTFMCTCLEIREPQPPGTISDLQQAGTDIAVSSLLSKTAQNQLTEKNKP